ncbi:MAG: response regulator transcription factor [Vulcanimicrobiota bacterium]
MRIVLADDHPLVRKGIRTTLAASDSFEVVAEAADGDGALRAVLAHKPDLLLLDLSMPGLSPQALIEQARQSQPDLKVLILTAFDDDVHLRELSHLTLSGYLLKDEAIEHLMRALKLIDEGAVWFSQSVSDKIRKLSHRLTDPDLHSLSSRDREVLRRIGQGLDNKIIAEELHLAEQTVRNYVSRLYLRIGVASRAEAVVWARERALQ